MSQKAPVEFEEMLKFSGVKPPKRGTFSGVKPTAVYPVKTFSGVKPTAVYPVPVLKVSNLLPNAVP